MRKNIFTKITCVILSFFVIVNLVVIHANTFDNEDESVVETDEETTDTYHIEGVVYLDTNENGVLDEDEKGIEDIKVSLYQKDNLEKDLMNQTTNLDGKYSFDALTSDEYLLTYESLSTDLPISQYVITNLNEEENIYIDETQNLIKYENLQLNENKNISLSLKYNEMKEDTSEIEEVDNIPSKESEIDEEIHEQDQETQTIIHDENDETKENVETKPTETKPIETKPIEVKPNEIVEDSKPLDMKELNQLEENNVGLASEKDSFLKKLLNAIIPSDSWTFDAYYVNQPNKYHVDKTDDFSLKYQMEFHTNIDIEANLIEIRIPAKLFNYRKIINAVSIQDKDILPTEIAIPKGTLEEPVESPITAFNYRIEKDEETGIDYLVIFNYKKIIAGSNMAFQVLYKNLNVMNIKDGQTWSLQPTINVDGQSKQTTPLTGSVDTCVEITKLVKRPYSMAGKSYSPGLYTPSQVEGVIGKLPTQFQGENFHNYKYVVWEIEVKGKATQPYNLDILEYSYSTYSEGIIVGFSDERIKYNDELEYYNFLKDQTKREFDERIKVVTAYPKDESPEDDNMWNETRFEMLPLDHRPENNYDNQYSAKFAYAEWRYVDYHWKYYGGSSIKKDHTDDTYKGWLSVYSQKNADLGDFPFRIHGETKCYEYTHDVNGSIDKIEKPIDGKKFKMMVADDLIYAYDLTNMDNEKNSIIMNDKDYYFSSVSIKMTDWDYDIFEDKKINPLAVQPDIYAMFFGKETWEKVTNVDVDNKGNIVLTAEDIARGPWRIKVEYETVNYSVEVDINVKVRIRKDSPTFHSILSNEDEYNEIRLENLAAVTYETRKLNEESQTWEHESWVHDYVHNGSSENDYNYSEPGCYEITEKLYEETKNPNFDPDSINPDTMYTYFYPMRNNAFVTLNTLSKKADSYKTYTSYNDTINGKVHVQYNLTAYHGYEVYDSSAVSYLKNLDIQKPVMKEVVFYDLLPYGMKFDPSVSIVAGRIIDIKNEYYQKYTNSWNTNQVEVEVDPNSDIVLNYRNTGRTMIKFHLKYTGNDPSVFTSDKSLKMWLQGWGVSFGAYVDWNNMNEVNEESNLAAFMPEIGDHSPLLGQENQVFKDNGEQEFEYQIFGRDINEDKITDIRNILYAKSKFDENFVQATESGIFKKVKADADKFGGYKDSATVILDGGYTYDINLKNFNGTLSNIVIFDRLENASDDRTEEPAVYQQPNWYGTFDGINTKDLDQLGIDDYIIYYSDQRNAMLPEDDEAYQENDVEYDVHSILTNENGWYSQQEWNNRPLSEVKAIAIAFGETYNLKEMNNISFQIHMKAPSKLNDAKYAYNNPSYYSTASKNDNITSKWVEGNSVKVELGTSKEFEVIKKVTNPDNIPEMFKDYSFEYQLTDNGNPLDSRIFELWKYNGEDWIKQSGLHATTTEGYFYLYNNEKAVFSLESSENINVKETDHPFWKVEYEINHEEILVEGSTKEKITYLVKNTYQSVLYLTKKVQSNPNDINISDYEFKFQITSNGEPCANVEYWLVDSARLDGGVPEKLGKGQTDEKGMLTMKANQILALFVGDSKKEYTVTEIESSNDWIIEKNDISVILKDTGSLITFNNIYKWKDLYIIKNIRHQDANECTQEFTFEVLDENKKYVTGNEWVIVDENGNESLKENEHGTLDNLGRFSVACAGKKIKIKGLEGGKEYTITETNSGDLYQPLENQIEVEMPIYSSSKTITFINDYLLRDLSVKKVVIMDSNDIETDTFIKFDAKLSLNDKPCANQYYEIYALNGLLYDSGYTSEDGIFPIINGYTTIFKELAKESTPYKIEEIDNPDDNYIQIYPTDGKPIESQMKDENSSEMFINGSTGNLMIEKQYAIPEDEISKRYYQEIWNSRKLFAFHSTFYLEIQNEDGTWIPYSNDEPIVVINSSDGNIFEGWIENGFIDITPNIQFILPNITNKKYRLKELAKFDNDVVTMFEKFEGKDYVLNFSQYEPKNNGVIEEYVKDKPLGIIYNQISLIPVGSDIYKHTLNNEPVPYGSKLTYRVEQYNGETWYPASGISYVAFDEITMENQKSQLEFGWDFCEETVKTTDETGEIELFKGYDYDDGNTSFPVIRFLEKDIKVNPSNPQKGTYRVVELQEKCDIEWGKLTGYMENELDYIGSVGNTDAIGFVNSNITRPIEIAKEMDEESDQTFVFILKQVLRANSPIGSQNDILEDKLGTNIDYEVYDSETNERISIENTGNVGEIRLKAGQYARLMTPVETTWTVSEKFDIDYQLKNLESNNSNTTTKLSDNLMVIQSKTPIIPITLNVIIPDENYLEGTNLNDKKDDILMEVVYSDGHKEKLEKNDYSIINANNEEPILQLGSNDVVFKFEDLIKTVNVDGYGTTSITQQDVQNKFVTDAKTNQQIDISGESTEGMVNLPSMIMRNGTKYIVTKIDNNAYSYTSLTNINLPNTITEIGYNAFAHCDNLTNITISESVTTIEYNAFEYCNKLESIIIPKSVISIEMEAFRYCDSLYSVEILGEVEEISSRTFDSCINLTSVKLPDNLKIIGTSAFRDCRSLQSIDIPESVTTISSSAFSNCIELKEVNIPKNVNYIGSYAFQNCSSLTSIEIPDGVINIEAYVFANCINLTSVKLPDNLETINSFAFYNCYNLITLSLPKGVTTIGNQAFDLCSKLESINIPEGVKKIGLRTFAGCNALKSIILPESLNSIGDQSFISCFNLKEIIIPENVTTIGYQAFDNCSQLEKVILPSDLKVLYASTFYRCNKLENINLPEGLIEIQGNVFGDCFALKNIIIPNSVETIGANAFRNCKALTSITIPSNVITIGTGAFDGWGTTQNQTINICGAEGSIAGSPWGANVTNTTINWNYTGQ